MSDVYSIITDSNSLIVSVVQSNLPASNGVPVSYDVYLQAKSLVGRATYGAGGITALKVEPQVPSSATLSDWRVGLTLWGRMDAVNDSVSALTASKDPKIAMTGKIAAMRLQYANTVQRSELMQLKDAFGFTADDVDQSLWRADRVAQGDLSGVWPLTSGNAS